MARDLLDLWEWVRVRSPARRALALLGAADPDALPEELAGLTLGRRDARLMALRERVFGPRVEGLADCPDCGESLELTFDLSDIRIAPDATDEVLTVVVGEFVIRARPPTSGDLLAIEGSAGVDQARRRLFEQCVLAASHRGEPVAAAGLPDDLIAVVSGRLAEADPQADIRIALSCPACGHRWSAPFDMIAFFSRELDGWARRLLRDVHELASAYGWCEADVLALSPLRRRLYLEMIRS
jgi:hypothetical protein